MLILYIFKNTNTIICASKYCKYYIILRHNFRRSSFVRLSIIVMCALGSEIYCISKSPFRLFPSGKIAQAQIRHCSLASLFLNFLAYFNKNELGAYLDINIPTRCFCLQEEQAVDARQGNTEPGQNTETQETEPTQPSPLATMWTFLITFFSSLIPERPLPVNAN